MNEGKSLLAASREPYWEEMSADQKIETLRDFLAQACHVANRQQEIINSLLQHYHDPNGRLMEPLRAGANQTLSAFSGGAFTADNGIPFRLRTARERR